MKTDSILREDIMDELKCDPSITHEHIGVSVSNGVVTLSGNVPSYLEKHAAERAAQRVSGVKAVVEKIEVKLPGISERDDQDIADAIIKQFKWHVQIPDELVKVSVEDGWVSLSGEVNWEYQRTAVEKAIRGLTGVRGISNNLTIKTKSVDSDTIKSNIRDSLKREAEREANNINVQVLGSRVILKGTVHSFAEKNSARWAAWSAPGVTSVENNLKVAG